jgi:hypothetical protein
MTNRKRGRPPRPAAAPPKQLKQQIGFLLQFLVLVFLPVLIFYDLDFGFRRLLVMPLLTVAGVAVFWIGYRLRES